MKIKVIEVTNQFGIPFNVRVVERGDKYGRDNSLTHYEEMPLVEFYDGRYTDRFDGVLGQFVSRYYLNTLAERGHGGLMLDGGVENWQVSSSNMSDVREYLIEQYFGVIL